MNIWNAFLGASMIFISISAQATRLNPIIDSFKLVDLIETSQVKILEIRSDKNLYLKQHIPGSVFIPYVEFRGPKNNPGKLPELNSFAKSLGNRGLDPSDAVVIVHDGITTTDFGSAARVYWTLKSFGFEDLAILNGGFRSYQKDGFALVSGPTKASKKIPTLSFNAEWYADSEEVEKYISNIGNSRLLDARPNDFYSGKAWHDAAARPGILPGADQFSFEAFFDKKTPLLKSSDEVYSIVEANGLRHPKTISYCNTGHWAATNWFVLSEIAGVENVKLYAESMVGWSTLGKPMENVPTPVQFAILKTKKWFNSLVN